MGGAKVREEKAAALPAIGGAVAEPAGRPAAAQPAAAQGGRVTLCQIPMVKMPAAAMEQRQEQAPGEAKLPMRGRQLGEILLAHGRISEADRQRALRRQMQIEGRLGEIFVAEGIVSEGDVVRALSEQTGIPFVSEAKVARMPVPTEAISLLPMEHAERLGVLPLALKGRKLYCALLDPSDLSKLDELQFLAGVPSVRGVFATGATIRSGLRRFYRGELVLQEQSWESLLPGEIQGPSMPASPGSGSWEHAPVAELPAALLLEAESPSDVLRMRERLVGLLLSQRGAIGGLPALVRRLALRLGATSDEAERAAAATEGVVLLAPAGVFQLPGKEALEAALVDEAGACTELLEGLAGGEQRSPATAAFVAALAFAERAGGEFPDPGQLGSLEGDPRLRQETLAALAEELAAPG